MDIEYMTYEHVKELHKSIRELYNRMMSEIQKEDFDFFNNAYYLSVFRMVESVYLYSRDYKYE